MTQTFDAGNPGNADPSKTSFSAPGAAPQTEDDGDNTVVFEHEGRKFTKADLRKKLSSADEFINQLKGENAKQREVLDAANARLEKSISAMEVLKRLEGRPADPTADQQPVEGTTAQAQPVDPDAIANQVIQSLAQQKQKAQLDQNFRDVSVALTQAYGNAVDEAVRKTCTDSGLSYEEGVELARRNPKVFLKLFPAVNQSAQPSVKGNGYNSQSFAAQKTKAPSGYVGALKSVDRTAAYLKRLNELAG